MYLMNVCNSKTVTIDEGESLTDAARLMRIHNVRDLVVTRDAKDRTTPVGIITERDIVIRGVASQNKPLDLMAVSELLLEEPMILGAFARVDEAVKRMVIALVRRAPVVDTDGRLVGYVTLEGLLDAMSTTTLTEY